MSNKNRLLSAWGGFYEFMETSDNEAGYVINTKQDCAPIVERMKEIGDEAPGKDFRHVGFIPAVFIDQLMREGRWNDQAEIRKWLNDPDNRAFRSWQGQI